MIADLSLKKFSPLRNDVIFLDGLWGTGKSLLAPIIGGMSGVEKYKYNCTYEQLSCLHYLGKMSEDACRTLLLTYADMDQYHNLIGREVNLRWSDDSGFSNNPNAWRYIKRLFGGEGDRFVEKIDRENLALFLMSHNLLLTSRFLFEIFGSRIKMLHIVRHPVYVFHHWRYFLNRFEGRRVYTLAFDWNGQKVPWFWGEDPSLFVSLSLNEKTALSIVRMYSWLFRVLSESCKDEERLKVISFESIVLDTKKTMEEISSFLKRNHSSRLKNILKKQKIPRELLNKGKGHSWYGYSKTNSKDEEVEYKNFQKDIKQSIERKILDQFDSVVEKYNQKFPSVLCRYH